MGSRRPSPIGPAWDRHAPYRQTWRARSVPAAANDNRAPLERRLRPLFGWAVAAALIASVITLLV